MNSGSAGPGSVVQTRDVAAFRTPDGASIRLLLDTSTGSDGLSEQDGLTRRLIEIPEHSHFDGPTGSAGDLCYVLDGTGRLTMAGHHDLTLRSDLGLLLPPAAEYRLIADGPDGLKLDVVSLPAEAGHAQAASIPMVRALPECEVETTGDREFRVLFGPGFGCKVATQFVGDIPPGRAPDHSHPYDEVVLVLSGEGIAHVGGRDHSVSAGTCLHLPPGRPHCMENTGTTTMRVLGVFHPADSPAAKLS